MMGVSCFLFMICLSSLLLSRSARMRGFYSQRFISGQAVVTGGISPPPPLVRGLICVAHRVSHNHTSRRLSSNQCRQPTRAFRYVRTS